MKINPSSILLSAGDIRRYARSFVNAVLNYDELIVLAFVFIALIHASSVMFFMLLRLSIAINLLFIIVNWRNLKEQDWLSFLIAAPFVWSAAHGLVAKNPGALYEVPLFVYAPLTFLLVFLRKRSPDFIENFVRVCVFAAIYHVVVFFMLLAVPEFYMSEYFRETTGLVVQKLDGYSKVYSEQATPIGFLLPIVLLLQARKPTLLRFSLLFACLLMALLLGRKTIILTVTLLYAGLLTYFLVVANDRLKSLGALLAPLIFALCAFPLVLNVDLEAYGSAVVRGVVSVMSDGYSGGVPGSYVSGEVVENICAVDETIEDPETRGGSVRYNQIMSLLQEIGEAPLFGKGAGYVIPYCIRAETVPWRYELSWLGLTLNFGVMGLLIVAGVYLRWILSLIPMSLEILRPIAPRLADWKARTSGLVSSNSLPVLAGGVAFLANSLSNPYIMSVETIWILFLPYLCLSQRSGTRVT